MSFSVADTSTSENEGAAEYPAAPFVFFSPAIIGKQNPTHLYEQTHDRVGNHCGQEGENYLCATFCSFLLGRRFLEKRNHCPSERNQQANEGVEQADKGGNDGDDDVGTRLALLL